MGPELIMPFIVVNIGCLECGEESSIVGVFFNQEEADKKANEYYNDGSNNTWGRKEWHGQHYIGTFEWDGVIN
jgi:hypothetical protein